MTLVTVEFQVQKELPDAQAQQVLMALQVLQVHAVSLAIRVLKVIKETLVHQARKVPKVLQERVEHQDCLVISEVENEQKALKEKMEMSDRRVILDQTALKVIVVKKVLREMLELLVQRVNRGHEVPLGRLGLKVIVDHQVTMV